MSSLSDDQLLELAKHAALTAGKVVLDIYESGNYKSYEKSDESPVTSADYKANEVIMEILQAQTPDIPIMSEESKNGLLADREHWDRYWLIDPIDGTQEFVARSGDFAVNIALVENNKPVMGVVYWPPGETLYYASKGQGAFKQCPLESKQIHVRQFNNPKDGGVMIAISRRQSREKIMCRMSKSRTFQTIPLGSCSLKACFIAEGKADLFLRMGATGEWDAGASQCIVEEAGGCILDAHFIPLTYNERDTTENPDFLVMGDPQVNWQSIVDYDLQKSS